MNAIIKPQKRVYCFDTSAFLALSRTHEKVIKLDDAVWVHLGKMMEDESLISHLTVYEEIISGSKNPFEIVKWVEKNKKYFLSKTDAQRAQIPEIVRKFPDLIDFAREREQADPWLIALALEKGREATLFDVQVCIVVTQENPNSSKKIPVACKAFKVGHVSLREFFDEIRVSTKLLKK